MNRKRFKIFGLIVMIFCTMLSVFYGTASMKVVVADIIDDYEPDKEDDESLEGVDKFFEKHKDDLVAYQNEFEGDRDEKVIYLFTYPFSDELVDKIVDSYANLPFVYLYYADYELMWGYVENEQIKGWICINEPDVPFFNRKDPEISGGSDEASPVDEDQTMTEKQVLILVVSLVAGLIIMTGVLLRIFWKKEKK